MGDNSPLRDNKVTNSPTRRTRIIEIVLNIPDLPARAVISVLLLYRRLCYGYAFRRIPLTCGRFAIVDPEDYDRLAKHKWFLARSPTSCYAARWQRVRGRNARRKIWMHREVIDVPLGMVCDHINGDGLDNRKANLRPATVSQNLCNRPKRRGRTRSKYKGLEWDKTQRKWKARIQHDGRRIYLGSFASQIEAAQAYDRKAKALFGRFARPNFP
ncbi:MAG: AP2 domain-containing protein [Planctomycetota bacterium]